MLSSRHRRTGWRWGQEEAMAHQESSQVGSRRAFLKMVAGAATGAAVAGGIPAIVAAQKAPSFPKGTRLNVLEWVSFVPASDVEFKRLAAEFGKLAGIELKKKDRPLGQAFGHSLGDPNNWAYSVTWGFGGAEIDDKGKVVINSKATIEAVKFTVGFWKDCLDEGGLAWDDSSNNRAYLAGTISGTINGASIYFVAKRQFPEIAKVTNHGHMPKGPGGRFYNIGGQGRPGMSDSKNQQVAKSSCAGSWTGRSTTSGWRRTTVMSWARRPTGRSTPCGSAIPSSSPSRRRRSTAAGRDILGRRAGKPPRPSRSTSSWTCTLRPSRA